MTKSPKGKKSKKLTANVTKDKPAEMVDADEGTDEVPVETNEELVPAEDEPMETSDNLNTSNNEPVTLNAETTLITDNGLDLEKDKSSDAEEVCIVSEKDDVTSEKSVTCTEINDSITIICADDEKEKSSEKTVISVLEPDKIIEDISDVEVISTTEIEEAAIATQIIANEEQTVEDGEEWTMESRLESFMKWCLSKGITISPKVTVTSEGTSHRYGMMATADIKKGEILFTVPRSLTLHPDNSRIVAEIVDYEDWLDSIGQSLDDSSGWATLLIALMLEFNDKDSFWAPYLRLVPKAEEFGHPLFWTPEEHKDELQGTTLLYDIQRDVYNIESEYKQYILPFVYRYKDVCGRTERYNLALYKRLVAFVMAYSFTEDFDSQPGMVPLADMLNHSVNNNAHLVFGEDTLKMVALKKIGKGEEVFNTFGKLGNAELLQMYGYADKEPNIFDTLPIVVNTFLDAMEKTEKVSDSFFQAKVSLLSKTEIAPADDFFLFDRNGMRKGPDLLQMLKILFMPESEFEELLRSRAGNRPDSFYQKLLRKLKLARKTDTSSGVAIIDITDEEPEIAPPPKRKIVDLQEIDDNEPPPKQSCSGDMQMMYLQLASNPERANPLNMLQSVPSQFSTFENPFGTTTASPIVIDDSDDETAHEDPKPKDTKESDSVGDKGSESSDKSESAKPSKDGDKESAAKGEAAKEDQNSKPKESSTDNDSSNDNKIKTNTSEGESVHKTVDSDKTIEGKVDENPKILDSVAGENGNENVDDTIGDDTTKKGESKESESKEEMSKTTTSKVNTEKDNLTDGKDDKEVVDEESQSKKKGSIEDEKGEQPKDDSKVKRIERKENKGISIADRKLNGDINDDVVSIGDDIEDDLDDDDEDDSELDSDIDDIEFVSEDIRVKMTYANLNKELKPEWKDFIKSVLNIQLESLKSDKETTVDEARGKMSDREFYSYQIRQGQRSIVKTFLSNITT